MNVTDLINKLMNYYGDTPVVIFKDDEQFEIKGVCIERADGDNNQP